MKSDEESLSFGRYLQTVRLEKKISLEEVSAQTRIGLGNLLLIEQEDYERLPAEVFVKGFLRSYAAAVGADGDEAVLRYESRLGVVQKIAESEASTGRQASKMRWKLLISLGLLLGIIILSIFGMAFFLDQSEPDKLIEQKNAADKEQMVNIRNQPGLESDAKHGQAIPEKMLLRVTALEDTWLKVIIDENEATEYSLSSGDRIELEAVSGYNLLIGNAGGLKITLNDKPVSIPGKSGHVVTIHLPYNPE